MARKHYYIDNEEIAEEDAFDENGIIRDGVTTRFPIFMTDSEGRTLVDAMGAPLDPSYTRRGTFLPTIATASVQSMIAILTFKKHTLVMPGRVVSNLAM